MSRSRKKNPIGGWTTAETEKKDKRLANRRHRRINRVLLSQGAEVFRHLKEISNVWCFDKDGKTRFDPEKHPQYLRK